MAVDRVPARQEHDDLVDEALHIVVGHHVRGPLELHEARIRDVIGEVTALTDVADGIVGLVHDERRDPQQGQRRTHSTSSDIIDSRNPCGLIAMRW